MGESNSDSEFMVTITDDKLTLLIISSLQTLQRNKKKCGRLEVYNLLKDPIEFKISLEVLTGTLNSLVENESVITN